MGTVIDDDNRGNLAFVFYLFLQCFVFRFLVWGNCFLLDPYK